jgi:hypothetical protein
MCATYNILNHFLLLISFILTQKYFSVCHIWYNIRYRHDVRQSTRPNKDASDVFESVLCTCNLECCVYIRQQLMFLS